MGFVYGKQDLRTWDRCREVSCLLTNGLGGYASMTAAFSVPRCDQGILIGAVKAPNERLSMVHRLSESLHLEDRDEYLSTQTFADGRAPEDGFRNLSLFTCDGTPCWVYETGGVRVERRLCVAREANAAAVVYTLENRSGHPCTLEVVPQFKFAPKEEALQRLDRRFVYREGKVTSGGLTLYLSTDARVEKRPMGWQLLAYPEDAKDGRPERGLAASCCAVVKTLRAGAADTFEIVFSMDGLPRSGVQMLRQQEAYLNQLIEESPL